MAYTFTISALEVYKTQSTYRRIKASIQIFDAESKMIVNRDVVLDADVVDASVGTAKSSSEMVDKLIAQCVEVQEGLTLADLDTMVSERKAMEAAHAEAQIILEKVNTKLDGMTIEASVGIKEDIIDIIKEK